MGYLIIAQVTEWTTKKPGKRVGVAYGGYYLLNTNRIIEMVPASDTATSFWYADDPDDPRDSPGHITVNVSLATIQLYHDTAPLSKFATFAIFPGYDITETPVDTLIEWADVAYIYQTNRDVVDGVAHMVYYRNDWKRVECLINDSILGVFFDQNGNPD